MESNSDNKNETPPVNETSSLKPSSHENENDFKPIDEYNESASDYDDYNDVDCSDGKSLDVLPIDDLLCFSPPKHSRSLKKMNQRRKSEIKSKLINSADYLDKNSTEEISSITDSLRDMQNEHENSNNNPSSVSAPASSSINFARPFGSIANRTTQNETSFSDRSLNNLTENSSLKSKIF
jgi:hypothetical protein